MSPILAKTVGYFAEQHTPMHPCRTPRTTITAGRKLLTYSIKGAPKIAKNSNKSCVFFVEKIKNHLDNLFINLPESPLQEPVLRNDVAVF